MKVIIDTDMGVDDAAAVAWLLSQSKYDVDLVGITTVAGNTTLENVTNNVMTILEATNHMEVPVVMGASAPLAQKLTSTGIFSHGPDGFWFQGQARPHDLSRLPADASGFLCAQAKADVTLIALGPLTNVAEAIARCPAKMAEYRAIILLGGAKKVGNITPLAEFNIWVDPEAADQVFKAGLMPKLIPQDTFDTFTISYNDIDILRKKGTMAGRLLAAALQPYVDIQLGLGGAAAASLPDVTAVMIAVDDQLIKKEQSALIKMLPEVTGEPYPERLVRGQTIIGLNMAEKAPMIADDQELSALAKRAFSNPDSDLEKEIGLILARETDNITIVMEMRTQRMHQLFLHYLVEE